MSCGSASQGLPFVAPEVEGMVVGGLQRQRVGVKSTGMVILDCVETKLLKGV